MTELLASVSWSLIGFLVGWLVGREMLFISQIREATVPQDERERTDHKVTPASRSRLLGFIVVLLALFSVVQGSFYTYDTQKTSQCQAQFNADFAKVIGLRAQWADENSQALNKMLDGVLNGATPEIRRKFLVDYLNIIHANDAKRAATPLPKLEDRNC